MKRFSRLLIALLLAFATLQVIPVQAKSVPDNVYPMEQTEKNFEVSLVKNDGSFQFLAAFSTFDEAKAYMKESGDTAVVRAADSVKQTKIIAMNSGVAYTCEWERAGTVSLNSVSSNFSGYMSSYRQIYYLDTVTYNGNGHGNVKANIGGFECYVDLDVIELIPYKYVDQGIAIHLADDLYVKPAVSCYTVKTNGNYRDLVYTSYGIYKQDGSAAPVNTSVAVGPAADWMQTGNVYYSMDDVTFYNDKKMTDLAGVYYNYYQFMPLRTKTAISAEVFDSFLTSKGYGPSSALYGKGAAFVQAQNDYGVNALMVYAQACLESGYGKSTYAKTRNNLFGLGAYDSNPDNAFTFESVYECLELQMGYYLRNYFYADSSLFFGAHYGNKGSGIAVKYASDPDYGQKISGIAYAIDKFANNNSGNLSEYNSKTIGVISTYSAKVMITPGGTCTYTTEYRPGYQLNNTVAIIGEEGDYYRIQSDNYLNENGYCINVLQDSDVIKFDWNHNVGYIRKSDVTIISSNTVIEKPEEELVKIGEAKVVVTGLRIRTAPTISSSMVGYTSINSTYDVYSIEQAEGYTWYQIGRNQYIADDNGEWISYKANGQNQPVEPEKPAEPETPVVPQQPEKPAEPEIPQQPEDDVNAHILSFVESISEENGILSISGEAFIQGMDVINVEDTKHTLELFNLETEEVLSYEAVTSSLDTPEFIGDNHTYKAVLYSSSIDLDDIPKGNYVVRARVTTNGVTNSKLMYPDSSMVNIKDRYNESTGMSTSVIVNNMLKNRLEIIVEKNGIDKSLIHKPTIRYSTRGIDQITFNGDQLSFEGYGYMFRSAMTESNHPSYRAILVDENGASYEFNLNAKSSFIDYSILYGYDYKLDFADFDGSINLGQLPAGKYRMYLDMSNDSFRDIDEIINFTTEKTYSGTSGSRTYTLSTSNVHGRFILEVTE